jgi:hypothetical protein
MSSDIANAANRIRPGPPGTGLKFTFSAAASAAQAIPFHITPPVGGFAVGQGALYVSFKVTEACHICFGGSAVGNPTNNDPLFEPADGWQDFVILPADTHFRVKGDSMGGDIYMFSSGG